MRRFLGEDESSSVSSQEIPSADVVTEASASPTTSDAPVQRQSPFGPAGSEATQTKVEAAPEAPEVPEASEEPEAPEANENAGTDEVGPPITLEAVQELLDDMVRPALQADGGDISLLKVEDNSIFVKLTGACSSCASSSMTMQMGVEALLKEEFPQMKEVVNVT